MVTPIGLFAGVNSQNNIQKTNAKLQAVIASLVSGKKFNKASDDVASLSIAMQLQSGVAELKQVDNNIAQTTSITQIAAGGVSQIQDALQQLKSLAIQASSPILTADAREQLNEQFQELAEGIDQIVQNTKFNDKKLLGGDLTGEGKLSLGEILTGTDGSGDLELSVDDLSTANLFGGELDISTAAGAQAAVEAIGQALTQTTSVQASIGAFEQSIQFLGANVGTAIVNQQAAQSSLIDTDFAEASTQFSLLKLQHDAGIAIAAQANKLNPALLQLIG